MTYYDILGVSPSASRFEILLAYNKKVALLAPRSPKTHQQFVMVQKAFEVLSRDAKRTQYDNLSQASSAWTRNATDPIEELVEAYKSRWKYLFQYPAWLMTEKVGMELLMRVVFTIIGGLVGFGTRLLGYSDRSGNVSPRDVSTVPGELRTDVVLFAIVFFFSREIYLVLRWLMRRYGWSKPTSAT
jgi:hypothetical protein